MEEEERLERERVAAIESAITESMQRLRAKEQQSANHVDETTAAAAEAAGMRSRSAGRTT